MKKILFSFLTLIIMCLYLPAFSQNVAINATGAAPNASAMLDVQSTTKGMLIPRMTTAQKNSIASPAAGLLVYDITTSSFWVNRNSGWTEIISTSNNIWNTNSNSIYWNGTGNVGIGTDTPKYDIELYKYEPAIGFYDTQTDHFSGFIKGFSNRIYINAYRKLSSNKDTAGNVILQSDNGDQLAGNVGIGETNPLAKLHINNGRDVSLATNGYLMLGSITGSNIIIDNNEIGLRNNGAWGQLILQNDDGASVRIGNKVVPAGYKVGIAGKLICEEVDVKLSSNWADYVFEPDYKLMPLNKLEQNIKDNNHLPGIPSAEEIKNNGLLVGDVEKKEMEKIEELTLYIIDLNKRLEKVEKENEILKSKINDHQ